MPPLTPAPSPCCSKADWSPAPYWKSNGDYIGGSLRDPESPAFLAGFASAIAADAAYLSARGVPVAWWGLQNEPAVGCGGRCIYSCCCIPDANYSLAFKATAGAIRAALPNALIHASSWSGSYWSPTLARDPGALALVDAWTFHRVGAPSSEQIERQAFFLNNTHGKPVLNNEFEYLDNHSSPNRTLNTAQSIMNWFAFENAPSWFWLHALKPSVNAEAAGYGLGIWQPPLDPNPALPLPPGHWDYAPLNYHALAGFLRYLPWNAVRVDVGEDEVRPTQRVLAYLFDPTAARWLGGGGGAAPPQHPPAPPHHPFPPGNSGRGRRRCPRRCHAPGRGAVQQLGGAHLLCHRGACGCRRRANLFRLCLWPCTKQCFRGQSGLPKGQRRALFLQRHAAAAPSAVLGGGCVERPGHLGKLPFLQHTAFFSGPAARPWVLQVMPPSLALDRGWTPCGSVARAL